MRPARGTRDGDVVTTDATAMSVVPGATFLIHRWPQEPPRHGSPMQISAVVATGACRPRGRPTDASALLLK